MGGDGRNGVGRFSRDFWRKQTEAGDGEAVWSDCRLEDEVSCGQIVASKRGARNFFREE